jgi:3-dehydrosphinganine reductase
MLLYNISVHMYFPATIYSPGYEAENRTKPKITLKIEETDEGQKPEDCAEALLQGVARGNFHINSEVLGNIFRTSTRGTTPYNNVLMDLVYSLIGLVGLPIWRMTVDKQIIGHRKEHEEYLTSKGFYT